MWIQYHVTQSSYIHYDLTQPNNNNNDDDDNLLDYAQLRNQTQHLSETKTNKWTPQT